jgi:very-short-patch-repair endonuclease
VRKKSYWEEVLAIELKNAGFDFVREHHFAPNRKYRFDFALLEPKIAVEIEGGIWIEGRHTRPEGFIADCEKYNHAVLLGWRVLRFTSDMVNNGQVIPMLKQLLGEESDANSPETGGQEASPKEETADAGPEGSSPQG